LILNILLGKCFSKKLIYPIQKEFDLFLIHNSKENIGLDYDYGDKVFHNNEIHTFHHPLYYNWFAFVQHIVLRTRISYHEQNNEFFLLDFGDDIVDEEFLKIHHNNHYQLLIYVLEIDHIDSFLFF